MRSGSHRNRETWDRLVNEKWGGSSPILSDEASIKAAKRLYRKAMGREWEGPVKIGRGNRQTWIRGGVLIVNPDQSNRPNRGLREIIHAISHYAHARLNPREAPHSRKQAVIEGKLTTYAIRSGWLEPGKLERKTKS